MTAGEYKKLLVIFRAVFIIAAISIVLVLVSREVVLSGNFVVKHDFLDKSPFFSELVPLNRVSLQGNAQKLIAEPVYTTLSFPRPFKHLQLDVRFSNPQETYLAFGPNVAAGEFYTLQALDHPGLNNVFANQAIWSGTAEGISAGGKMNKLYQKRSAPYIYASLSQFWESPSDQQSTGYYGLDFITPYLPKFEEGQAGAQVNYPLQGTHQFLVAINQDELEFLLKYQDVNNQVGADPLKVSLFNWQGESIQQWQYQDDGVIGEQGVTSQVKTAQFSLAGLPSPAVYRIAIETTNDVFLQKISVSTPYLVAKGAVKLAGGAAYESEFGKNEESIKLYTSARLFTAMTPNRQTLQDIYIGQEALTLSEPLEHFNYQLSSSKSFLLNKGYQLFMKQGNVEIAGRGVFAFSQENYFNPWPWLVDETMDLEKTDVQYLVTNYEAPLWEEGRGATSGWKVQQLFVDLSEVYSPDQNLRLKLAAPGLQEYKDVKIHEVTAHFNSDPITFSNAFEKFKRAIKRELNK